MNIWTLTIVVISIGLFLSSIFLFFQNRNSKEDQRTQFSVFVLMFSLFHLFLFLVSDMWDIIPTSIENFSSLMFGVIIISLPPSIYNFVLISLDSKFEVSNKIFRVSYALAAINIISFIYLSSKPKADEFLYEVIENVMNYSNFISFIFIFPGFTIYYLYKIVQLIRKKSISFELSFIKFIRQFQIIAIGYFVFISLYYCAKYVDSIFFLILFRTITLIYVSAIILFIIHFFRDKNIDHLEEVDIQSSARNYNEIADKLKKIFENEKPFLDSKITIYQLAKMIDTNEKYLSNYLNEVHNINFYNFLNRYRIEVAKDLLIDPLHDNYTIETIANLSGFHSKSSFNTAFKKETGFTPSEYKKGNRNKLN